MSNPLHARHYADGAVSATAIVQENVQIAQDTWRVRFDCPEMAERILPGQFLMLRMGGCNDPLLGRPLALYDTVLDDDDRPAGIDVVYLVMGKLTSLLARSPAGTAIEVWGPLGNGFDFPATDHLIMVAGGIGQTPFVALARERLGLRVYGDPSLRPSLAKQITLCYGARTASLLAGVEDFEALGVRTLLATDDGTRGHDGLVTDLLKQELDHTTTSCHVVCCGPEPMMAAAAGIAAQRNVSCQVSLETPMACGVGICFTCVAKVRDASGHWDYKRTCVDGPVFDARSIIW